MISSYNQTNTIASGSDFDFDLATGPDVSLARTFTNVDSAEVRYFSTIDSDDSANYSNSGPIQVGRFGLTNAVGFTSHNDSRLQSAEVNWLRLVGDRFSYLVGFRWVEFDDSLHFYVTRPGTFYDVLWKENNQLYGGQVGGSFDWLKAVSPISIKTTAKAGVFGNSAGNDVTFRQTGVNGVVYSHADDRRVALVGELGFVSTYQVSQHVALRTGYQLLWLESVATATDQAAIATNSTWDRQIDLDGGVFYHGATVGIDVSW
jgi:hypothetical protein